MTSVQSLRNDYCLLLTRWRTTALVRTHRTAILLTVSTEHVPTDVCHPHLYQVGDNRRRRDLPGEEGSLGYVRAKEPVVAVHDGPFLNLGKSLFYGASRGIVSPRNIYLLFSKRIGESTTRIDSRRLL